MCAGVWRAVKSIDGVRGGVIARRRMAAYGVISQHIIWQRHRTRHGEISNQQRNEESGNISMAYRRVVCYQSAWRKRAWRSGGSVVEATWRKSEKQRNRKQ